MRALRTILSRLRSFWQRRELKQDIDEELRFHLEQRTAEYIASGMSPQEAEREARKRFGNLQNVREECRDSCGVSLGESAWREVRFGWRALRRSPGFTVTAVLTLALGIGSTTAMFSVLRALVIEPFSYPYGDRLVQVWSNESQPLSTPDYFDIGDQATVFAEFGVYVPKAANLGGDNVQSVHSVSCTPGVLRAFGVAPAMGRLFEAADDEKGAPLTAIISHGLWQRAFGGDPKLVGRSIRLNGGAVTVIGVMPASFEFSTPWMRAETCDVWLPLQSKRGEGNRGSHWLCAVGRLKANVTVEAADAEIKAIGARLKASYPDTNASTPFMVRSLYVEMTRNVGSRIWMLFGAVALVLLIACANVSSMLLARSAWRQGEFGVRVAIGATRSHVLRLVISESLLISVAGTIAGLGLSFAGLRALQALAPATEARKAAMILDGNAAMFAAGLALVTALLAGLPPALAALRVSATGLLREGGQGAGNSRRHNYLLRGLIVAQVAVAFVLANCAVLFSSSYAKLLAANDKLATEHVLSAEVNLRGERYGDQSALARFCERATERASALPGVAAAGITTKLPLEGGSSIDILVNDEVFDPSATRTTAEVSPITPGYFAASGLSLLQGRTLEPWDAGYNDMGVVVNRTLADKCWPGQDPLGKIIRPNVPNGYHARVVGVVESVRQWGPEIEPQPEIYWTPDHAWGQTIFLIVRSQQPAIHFAPELRHAVAELDSDLPLARIRTLQMLVEDATQGQRIIARMVDFFMAAALVLVAVGLYGTLSYHVLQRTREIGVRLALGAVRGDIVRLVFRLGFRWVLAGVIIGLGIALAVTSLLQHIAYGISAIDPLSLLGATLTVVVIAAISCWWPARRAAKVDPMEALRCE